MRLKILHILHSLQVGGLENGVVNLINLLDHGRFEHSICCITSSGPMADRIIQKDVQIYQLKKEGRDYFLPFKLMKLIRNIKPDIVHTRNWSAIDGIIGARFAGVKRIIHGEHGREYSDPDGANRLRQKIRKALSPWVTEFVAVSAELRRWLVEVVGISERKVIQITNGVDTDKFKPEENKAEVKVKLGFEPYSFLIGNVGRLDPVKDQQTLIRAFSCLVNGSDGIPKVHNSHKMKMIIVGSGPECQNLKKITEKQGVVDKVCFPGELKDIIELMQGLDIFVLPSVAEGVSNTILEAMACGLPVVATSVGGNRELVDEGRSGFIFSPGDYQTLAKILAFYCNDPKTVCEHGRQGRIRAESLFSLSNMIEKYEKLYLYQAVNG